MSQDMSSERLGLALFARACGGPSFPFSLLAVGRTSRRNLVAPGAAPNPATLIADECQEHGMGVALAQHRLVVQNRLSGDEIEVASSLVVTARAALHVTDVG